MLRHPALRVILLAEVISAVGSQMSFVALPWLVLTHTGSPTQMGIVLAAQVLPAAMLGIPSALVVQRLGVRRTMLVSDLARAPLVAAVPLLHLAGLLHLTALLAVVFAIGVFNAPYLSAQRLIIPETFADDETLVVRGNALLDGAVRMAMLLGPACAGVAITAFGAQNVLFFDAASYLLAFAVLWRGLPHAAPTTTPGPGVAPSSGLVVAAPGEPPAGSLDGVRFVLRQPVLRRITLASLVFGFFYPPLLASLPVLTAQRYEQDPRVAGLLYAAVGAGSALGMLVVLGMAERVRPLRLGAVGAVGLCVPLWLLVVDLPAWQFALVMLFSGVFLPILNAPVLSQVMLGAPAQVRAQVMTLLFSVNLFSGPLALALTGPALQAWGLTPVYVLIALGVSAGSALIVTLAGVPRDGTG
jgi:predicted MFS family arabinose efflux permease